MSLDATVFCDCYEKGRLRTPPPSVSIFVGLDGSLDPDRGTLEEMLRFDEWRYSACEHPHGILLHHRLGNISLIGLLRSELQRETSRFPVLLGKVVYDGTHGGDCISVELVPELRKEIEALADFKCSTREADTFILRFRIQMMELVTASLSIRKPIAF